MCVVGVTHRKERYGVAYRVVVWRGATVGGVARDVHGVDMQECIIAFCCKLPVPMAMPCSTMQMLLSGAE